MWLNTNKTKGENREKRPKDRAPKENKANVRHGSPKHAYVKDHDEDV